MDPYRDESVDQLIARKPGRLNILVTQRVSKPGYITPNGKTVSHSQPREWNIVEVRYSYSTLYFGEGDPRITAIAVPVTEFSKPDVAGIERAIAQLRDIWGNLHVQDNSGAVPHLDQGRWKD